MLNGLGKGVNRGRLAREKALQLWEELRELPIQTLDIPADARLLESALDQNLAVYDASYLMLAQTRGIPLATVDNKLQTAARGVGSPSSIRK